MLLRGRRLDRLPVAGGQFLQRRFLRRGLWWQAHPYSLSAAPAGDLLRITVKDLGDHSAGLGRLEPGTPVAIEGAYGVFTAARARDEIAAEVARRGGRLVELVGSRAQVRLDAGALLDAVPDLARREAYVCGPEPLSRRLASELRRAGVAAGRIHFESFTF